MDQSKTLLIRVHLTNEGIDHIFDELYKKLKHRHTLQDAVNRLFWYEQIRSHIIVFMSNTSHPISEKLKPFRIIKEVTRSQQDEYIEIKPIHFTLKQKRG